MRAAHPLSPHAFSTLRRLTALTAVMTLTLTMVSCSIGESNGDPVISSLTAQKADATVPRNSKSDMDNEPLSSAVGTVSMITSDENRKKGAVSGDLTTTVVSRERSTDKFQWAVSIKPAVANQERTEYADNAQSAMSENMDLSSTGSAVVSPDGRYLSLILLPAEQQSGETAADLRTHIVVLDTTTGKTVRNATVSGVILGQVLTNSTLAVETAQNYFPAGSGKGSIRVFPITSSGAQESSFSTDQWLIGASGKNLLLAPDVPTYECTSDCAPYTVTRSGTDGHTIATLPGVTAVHPGGWVSQYRDPKAAASLLHTMHASPDNNVATEDARQKLEMLPKQLVHIDTGQTTDITDMTVDERSVPNGLGLVVYQDVSTGEYSRERKPAFWLSSSDDGHPHTENLEQFENH